MRSSNFCLPLTLVFRTQVLGRTRVMNIYSMIRHVNNNALHNKYLNTSSNIAVLLCRLRERERDTVGPRNIARFQHGAKSTR